MEKNWKRMRLEDFKKEIESLGLKELEKLWKEIREKEKGLQWEEFTDALDKRYMVEGEMMERNYKKGRNPWGIGVEKERPQSRVERFVKEIEEKERQKKRGQRETIKPFKYVGKEEKGKN